MATLRQWLNDFETRHGPVVCLRIGRKDYWYGDGAAEYTERTGWPVVDGLVPMDEAPSEVLDKEFDSGYGSPGCPPVLAWSYSHVFCIDQYDGATGWFALSRDPDPDCQPPMPGGG